MDLLHKKYVIACCALIASQSVQGQSSDNGGWRWRTGASLRQVQGPDVSIGASVTTLDLTAAFGAEVPIGAPPSAGDNLTIGDRTYTDGYVNDEGGFALTSDFGYNAGAQYNAVADTLTYTIAPTDPLAGSAYVFNSSTVAAAASGGFDDEIVPSFNFEVDRLLDRGSHRSGFVFGFGLFATNIDSNFGNGFSGTATADRYATGVTDVYNTTGVVLFNAPYDGGGGGPGQPTIPNQPATRTVTTSLLGTDTLTATSQVGMDWDMLATSFDCGYRWEWEHEQFSWNLSAGSTLHILDWKGKHQEQMTQTATIGGVPQPSVNFTSNSSENGLDFLIGAYLQAGVSRPVGEASSIGFYARYDLSQDMDVAVGPSRVTQDMSGWTAGFQWVRSF